MITIGEGQNVLIQNCTLSDIYVSEGCNMSFNRCPIGNVIPNDIDDAENRLDELEDRLNDIIGQIDDIENE